MEKLTIVIKGEPMPKQSVRSRIVWPSGMTYMPPKDIKKKAFVSHYQDTSTKKAESDMKLMVKSQLPPFWQPWDGPILIDSIILAFKKISSLTAHENRLIDSGQMVPKSTKPDVTDNLLKLPMDAMEGLVYTNDSRIIGVKNSMKCYWKTPGTYIKMLFFENNQEYFDYIKTQS